MLYIDTATGNLVTKGVITASSGSIGSWSIVPGGLSYGSNSFYLGPTSIAATINGHGSKNLVFKAGSNFGVDTGGKIWASDAAFLNTYARGDIEASSMTVNAMSAIRINANQITAGTISADRIDVNNLKVKQLDGATGTFNSLTAAGGTVKLYQNYIDINGVEIGYRPGYGDICVIPSSNNYGNVGVGGRRWDQVCADRLYMMYGLRRSEIAGIKWSAIDFDNDTLEIRHTVVKYKTTIAKDKTKNHSSNRTMVLNSKLKTYMLKLRSQQAQEKLLLGKAYKDTDYVCRWSDGTVMACNYYTNALRKMLAKHGLPHVRLHDLRHSCASFMLKMGCTMKEIQDWLGHRDIGTTMNIYAHLDIDAKKAVANKFQDMLTINV